METIIIDDELKSVELLEFYLGEYFSDFTITGKYTNPEDGFKALLKAPPQVLFLDINMPIMSGIQLLEKVQHLSIITIFLTAHPQHAIDAIKLNAFDYLLKPINLNEIIRVRTKILKQLKRENNTGNDNNIVKIKVSNTIHFFKAEDIIYANSEGNYTTVYCQGKKPLVITKNLKKIKIEYLNNYPFMRVHQSYIINLNHIQNVSFRSVNLTSGVTIPISKSNYSDLIKLI